MKGPEGQYAGQLYAKQGDDEVVLKEWDFSVTTLQKMSVSKSWNETFLGSAQGYKPIYAWDESIELQRPSMTTADLFDNIADNDPSRVTFAMSVRPTSKAADSDTPGQFFVSDTGATLVKMNKTEDSLGGYTGTLQATDGASGSVEIKTWEFLVMKRDVEVPIHGPNNESCGKNGGPVDDEYGYLSATL